MILQFEFSGFRSFCEPATLDLASDSLRTNVPRAGRTWGDSSERVAAVFGANASGKTTLLNAIWALAVAVRNPGSGAIYQPPSNRTDEDPSSKYRVEFVAHGVRYRYEVVARHWGIAVEALYSFPHGSERMLFNRRQDGPDAEIVFEKGRSLSGPTAEVLKITRPNALFMATALKYGHRVLAPVAEGVASGSGIEKVSFRDAQDADVVQRVVVEMLAMPEEQADLVSALLQAGDLGIVGIDIRSEEIPPEVRSQLSRMLEFLREGDEGGRVEDIPRITERISFTHRGEDGVIFDLSLGNESSGTLTWLTIAWHALNALRNGGVLLVDELDASLHAELVRYIVGLFVSPDSNPHGAQIIFTTHDVALLGNAPMRLLEPSNVWFVEKGPGGSSELYSLGAFDNRDGNNNERRYMAGKFGAVPDIDDGLLYSYLTAPLVQS